MRLTKAQRAALHAMFDGRCAYCGEPLGERWHADHVERVERKLARVPGKGIVCTSEVWRPHLDTFENLMPACPPCNIDKGAFTLDEWRRKLGDACGVLARNQPTYRHALRFGLVLETGAPIVFHFERVRDAAMCPAIGPSIVPASRVEVGPDGVAVRIDEQVRYG